MLTATVDDRGRILLPSIVRDVLEVKTGDELVFIRRDRAAVDGGPGFLVVKVEVIAGA